MKTSSPNFVLAISVISIATLISLSEENKYNEFFSWLRRSGGVVGSVYIDRSEVGGYGVFAAENLEPDQIILSIPYDLMLTPQNIPSELERKVRGLDVFLDELLALQIMFLQSKLDSSMTPWLRRRCGRRRRRRRRSLSLSLSGRICCCCVCCFLLGGGDGCVRLAVLAPPVGAARQRCGGATRCRSRGGGRRRLAGLPPGRRAARSRGGGSAAAAPPRRPSAIHGPGAAQCRPHPPCFSPAAERAESGTRPWEGLPESAAPLWRHVLRGTVTRCG